MDPSTGEVLDSGCSICGRSVAGTVLVFPYGKGSTVGSYAMYQLSLNGVAPNAIVNASAEPIVATGAIMSGIPMVDRVDISLIRSGDRISVDGDAGTVDLRGVRESHVVTSILRRDDLILLLRRSDKVGSYRGRWAGVSGFIEQDEGDEHAARREIAEETCQADAELVRRIPPQSFRNDDRVWTVHAFLFDVRDAEVRLDWEHDRFKWVSPEDLADYETVPGLGTVVERLLR